MTRFFLALAALLVCTTTTLAQAGRFTPKFRPPAGGGLPVKGGLPGSRVYVAPRYSTEPPPYTPYAMVVLGVLVGGYVAIFIFLGRAEKRREAKNLLSRGRVKDWIILPDQVADADRNTRQQMVELACTQLSWLPHEVETCARATFHKVQQCWAERDYTPLVGALSPALYQTHSDLLKLMAADKEFNRIERLKILRLEFIGLECAWGRQEAVALISFEAAVYFVDERGRHTRGPMNIDKFQEAWTLCRQADRWTVDDIKRSHEIDWERCSDPAREEGIQQPT